MITEKLKEYENTKKKLAALKKQAENVLKNANDLKTRHDQFLSAWKKDLVN
jgi:hypothetical protein